VHSSLHHNDHRNNTNSNNKVIAAIHYGIGNNKPNNNNNNNNNNNSKFNSQVADVHIIEVAAGPVGISFLFMIEPQVLLKLCDEAH
jgi:hypothetical protein